MWPGRRGPGPHQRRVRRSRPAGASHGRLRRAVRDLPARVTVAVAEGVVDRRELARILRPRNGIVAERMSGEGQFELLEGPFESYVRIVDVQPSPTGPDWFAVRQVVDYRLAIPIFGSSFAPAFRRRLGRLEPRQGGWPWWHPPARMDARAARVLSALAVLAVVGGY